MMAPLASFGIQQIAVMVTSWSLSTPETSHAWSAALWTSCWPAMTPGGDPMQITRRSALLLRALMESLQPAWAASCWIAAPPLPTMAPLSLPGMTKCTWTASGSSPIACTSGGCDCAVPPPPTIGDPDDARPGKHNGGDGRVPVAPRARPRPFPHIVGSPIMVSMRSCSPLIGFTTGSLSIWMRTPVLSRTRLSPSPPLPITPPVHLSGMSTIACTLAWPGNAVDKMVDVACPTLSACPMRSMRRVAERSAPAAWTTILHPEVSRIDRRPAPCLPITLPMLSPGSNTATSNISEASAADAGGTKATES
mmetsp:Transcript_62192/g.157067  ORF Transcript_62192/g.157067 Transcript_62192/m.157067 type:complete len:308 (-) Transcript_62192:330-1253(-)